MARIAYLLASVGHPEDERARRETIANDLLADDEVRIVAPDDGPLSIESTVEEEWAANALLRSLAAHEDDFDAFFVGCFGEPGLAALREFTDKPVVGSATASFYTAAQVADRFSCLTILDSTKAMVHRQVHEAHLDGMLASVRVVDAPVLDIDHSSEALVEDMIAVGRQAVEEDDAEALVPGCMSLAFARLHETVADEVGVPFLDPLSIGLGTASLWARFGITQSHRTFPEPDHEKLSGLVDER